MDLLMDKDILRVRNKTVQFALGELKQFTLRHPDTGAAWGQDLPTPSAPPRHPEGAKRSSGSPHAERQTYITVGVSGGADSLALTAICSVFYGADNVRAVIVDHGLQEGSDRVAQEAARQCREVLGIQAIVKRANINEGSGNLEERARDARYELLFDECAAPHNQVMNHSRRLFLAHTRDDQAETVLLGLGRGSGVSAVHGMREFDVRQGGTSQIVARPFLRNVTRQMTEEICHAFGLEYWCDPTNGTPQLTSDEVLTLPRRSQVRNSLLPTFDAIFPGIQSNLARTATLARIDEDYLEQQAQDVYQKLGSHVENDVILELSTEHLKSLPDAIRLRVLRIWLLEELKRRIGYNSSLTFERILEIDDKLIQNRGVGGSIVELGRGFIVRRVDKTLVVDRS
jgi:tRNA(Ile)-lysidine synthase